jgi:hypothetical protein
MSTRRAGPILLAAITVLATACATHVVTGTPRAAVATSEPTTSAAEAFTWLRTTDPQTGTSAELPGVAEISETSITNGTPGGPPIAARKHQVVTSRSGTVQMTVLQRAPGALFDFEGDVQGSRERYSGTIVSKQPVTVDGHRGLDYVITYTSPDGGPSVLHTRVVEAAAFAARITTRGVNKDLAAVAAVHARVISSMRVPAA